VFGVPIREIDRDAYIERERAREWIQDIRRKQNISKGEGGQQQPVDKGETCGACNPLHLFVLLATKGEDSHLCVDVGNFHCIISQSLFGHLHRFAQNAMCLFVFTL
jgi:hypothetical protein